MISTDAAVVAAPSLPLSRDQILRATARCLREVGYDATTIRRIAMALDCAVGSIYRYFRDKRDLLSAVTQLNLEPVAAVIASGGAMEESLALYYRRASQEMESYRLMFWLSVLEQGPRRAEGSEPGVATRCTLPEVVGRIIDGWGRQAGDAELAQRCWSMLHGSLMFGRDERETLRLVLEMLGRPGRVEVPAVAPADAAAGAKTSVPVETGAALAEPVEAASSCVMSPASEPLAAGVS